jgi:hypothetical protein
MRDTRPPTASALLPGALSRGNSHGSHRQPPHAALVFEGEECRGWCQFGSPDELAQIKSRRRYDVGLVALPDWRITCFFTGKGHRGRGVADAAPGGALAQIAGRGGGSVEGYPEETDDRTVSGSFLHTGPMAAFENHGFTRTRAISPHRWVVTRSVAAL